MSFYGNVVNPQTFFRSIKPDTGGAISILQEGDILTLAGDGQFITTEKIGDTATIAIKQVVSDGLYLQCKDDPGKWFKLTVNPKGVLEIYEVTKKEAN